MNSPTRCIHCLKQCVPLQSRKCPFVDFLHTNTTTALYTHIPQASLRVVDERSHSVGRRIGRQGLPEVRALSLPLLAKHRKAMRSPTPPSVRRITKSTWVKHQVSAIAWLRTSRMAEHQASTRLQFFALMMFFVCFDPFPYARDTNVFG